MSELCNKNMKQSKQNINYIFESYWIIFVKNFCYKSYILVLLYTIKSQGDRTKARRPKWRDDHSFPMTDLIEQIVVFRIFLIAFF